MSHKITFGCHNVVQIRKKGNKVRCHSWCAQDTCVKVGQYAASTRIKAKSSRKSLFFVGFLWKRKSLDYHSWIAAALSILHCSPNMKSNQGLFFGLGILFWHNLLIIWWFSDQVYFARRPSGTFIRLWYEWRWYGALPPPHHGRPRQCFSAQDLHLNSQEGIRWGEANFPSERKTGEHCVRRKSPPCDDHRALR